MDMVPWKFGRQSVMMDSLRDEFNQLFDRFWSGNLEPMQFGHWSPAVDLAETDEAVIVRAEVPGLDVKDVEISVEGTILTIRGEKKVEREEKGHTFHRVERRHGTFVRAVQLPAEVVADKAEAVFKQGVVEIKLPKTEEAKPKRLKIEIQP